MESHLRVVESKAQHLFDVTENSSIDVLACLGCLLFRVASGGVAGGSFSESRRECGINIAQVPKIDTLLILP